MPELPEVETIRRYFDRMALGQEILEVVVRDAGVIDHPDATEFIENLEGRVFTDSVRIGKYHFARLGDSGSVQFHYGMTGDLYYYPEGSERPRFERVAFVLEGGNCLGYDCMRKFGRLKYIPGPLADYLTTAPLGPDALTIGPEDFWAILAGRTGRIKSVLMDQTILAGLGNLYVDEICYRVRVHPASRAGKIPPRLIDELYDTMREVLQVAIELKADYQDYPDDWPFWQWRNSGFIAPDGKSEVTKQSIGGRTTYFAPGWQKLYD